MTRFERIVEAARLMALYRVNSWIYEGVQSDQMRDWEYWGDDASSIAGHLGYEDALADFKSDCPATRRTPFTDAGLVYDYEASYEQHLAHLEHVARYPDNPNGHTLYCPRGCNQITTTSGYDECGACGSVMRPNIEDAYYDSLAQAGQCQ